MTRPTGRHAVVVARHARRPIGSRSRSTASPGEPATATSGTSAQRSTSGFSTGLAHALRTLTGTPGLSPLASTGCDGRCANPAFYDRATGVWRHLNDLTRCRRLDEAPTIRDLRR